jgi:glutaredoxin
MSTHTITVMKTPGCGACIATASTFEKNLRGTGLTIDKVDMSQDEDAMHLAKDVLGYGAAPVVIVRDAAGEIVDHWNLLNLAKVAEWSTTLKSEQSELVAT